jgi:transposase
MPPYSPDMNPIEMCWSKIKTFLRAKAARTYVALLEAISVAIKEITAADARSWIKSLRLCIAITITITLELLQHVSKNK